MLFPFVAPASVEGHNGRLSTEDIEPRRSEKDPNYLSGNGEHSKVYGF